MSNNQNKDSIYYGFTDWDQIFPFRIVNGKCLRKVTKTGEYEITDPNLLYVCRNCSTRITREDYENVDPKDTNPVFIREDVIDKALALMQKAHAAQKDKAGGPEVLHPLRVGMAGKNRSEMIVGFLHDTVENGGLTKDDFEIAVKLNELRDNLKRGREGGFAETVRKHEAALKMFEAAGYPAQR